MILKVLGRGCPKCNALESRVKKIVERHHPDVVLEKVTDYRNIMEYQVMVTPALVVDGIVRCSGRIPQMTKCWAG
jgi:small redox-active disulfide protein 2